jgi:hypothetical protein
VCLLNSVEGNFLDEARIFAVQPWRAMWAQIKQHRQGAHPKKIAPLAAEWRKGSSGSRGRL